MTPSDSGIVRRLAYHRDARGRLLLVLNLTFKDDKIVEINAVSKRENLQQLDLAVFDN